MKLNKDCVRGILLALEENEKIHASWTTENFSKSSYLKDFSSAEIRYCAERLAEGGYLNIRTPSDELKSIGAQFFIVDSLSWNGHEFLDTIRDESVWKRTKQVASKAGTTSIPLLLEIGKSILQQNLGLRN